MKKRTVWAILLLFACIISRIITTIYYVEDIDCLRFALSASHYSVLELRPHFPGYPVYCFLLQALYEFTGHLAISFSILGGLAMYLIIRATIGLLKLFGNPAWTVPLGLLLFFNPQLWIMSNSYMPDILGLGLLMICLYRFADAWLNGGKSLWLFCMMTGYMLGVRLSYAPALFIPVLALWYRYRQHWLKQVALQTISVLVWLIPLIAITGITGLINVATTQTEGHFTKWGGSVISSKVGYPDRVISSLQSIWADGLGGWWPGRPLLYIAVSLLLILILVSGLYQLWIWWKDNRHTERGRLAALVAMSLLVYLIWAFFFQNVVHKPRHLMPFIPFICIIMAGGIGFMLKQPAKKLAYILVGLFMGGYIGNTIVAINHHFKPTAISQMKDWLLLHDTGHNTFVGSNIMGYYMEKHYWEQGHVMDIAIDTAKIAASYQQGDTVYSVQPLDGILSTSPKAQYDFYHDPFVNRMWAHLTLYQYQRP